MEAGLLGQAEATLRPLEATADNLGDRAAIALHRGDARAGLELAAEAWRTPQHTTALWNRAGWPRNCSV